MSEWTKYKLTDVGYLKRGKSKHRPRYAFHLYGGKYPFIQTGEIKAASKYIKTFEQTYSEAGLAQSKLWEKGTLCITIAANIAEIAILDFDACFPDSVLGFIPDKSKCNLDYVFYTLKYFQRELKAQAIGSVQDNINAGTFENIKFPFPSLSEQQAIAEVLSSLDDKIDLLHRQNKTLEQLAETIFRELFVDNEDENWASKKLDDVCIKINSGGTPSTKVSEYYNGNINWYSTKELNDCYLFDSISKITNTGLENSSAKLFPENTVVIAIYAAPTVGRLGILTNEAAFNQAGCGFIADEKQICFEYLYLHLLLSRQKLNEMASGSAQQNLNVGIMKEFEIAVPPSDLMGNFKEQIRPIFRKIKANSIQTQTLNKLRDTLLPKLMNGEIKVN